MGCNKEARMVARSRAAVVLVDDNIELLELLARSLEHLGNFQVVRAVDGVQGLEQVVAVHPDCVVVDIMMPGLDGYQLVKALRGDPATKEIPIVVLTALAEERDRLAGLVSGADQYLVKPIKPQDLIAAIYQALAMSQQERAVRLRRLAEEDGGW
jgi:two-component system alkaline phosphatase synthesis response regulator PhoP